MIVKEDNTILTDQYDETHDSEELDDSIWM
jgi:hypothetical protein